ncbi:hypothetical protein LCGC14_0154420 [marine sediment metagenome]|uniref:Protein kinase domain-containing protein n=1 Tax=marine sediment metagenome TaxID=412755 RepID=A0A0F9UX65_9ZZZZ|nr:hypothetical protein [Halomonas sp.]HDZ47065.1 protein kinase family protein [Halomonas sp.]HEB06883.1 protein kinase family protein [Halomonas sp.]
MPSTSLVGKSTPCGWCVVKMITTSQTSGGNFCTRYLVESQNGDIAFMKAMDLTRVMNGSLEDIQALINEYLFERNILAYCKDEKMSKVVVPLSAGELINNQFQAPLNRVFYIVFEKAEGDLREVYLEKQHDDWFSFFKAMHHVCIAAEQLHRAGIAHQDIKPSNILHFAENQSKIGDLGRVTDIQGKSPFINMSFPGDYRYAPLEVRYGITVQEFSDRFLADIYAIGSLVYQTVMGISLTAALANESEKISPNVFQRDYRESLVIHISSFSILMKEFYEACENIFGNKIAEVVTGVVGEMCYPDYEKRGAPKFIARPMKLNARRYTSKMATVIRLFYIEGLISHVK